MRPLIIYAHPDTDGYCPRILEQVRRSLEDYDLVDLYSEGYDPVIHDNELYTRGGKDVSKRNREIQTLIRKTDRLIFIYPVFWASMPAIMKGFMDKVFVSGFGFRYEGTIPRRLLKGKRALVIMTSGSPGWIYQFLDRTPIKLIKRHVLAFCGIRSRILHFGSCSKLTDKKTRSINRKVDSAVKAFVR